MADVLVLVPVALFDSYNVIAHFRHTLYGIDRGYLFSNRASWPNEVQPKLRIVQQNIK